MIARGAQGCKTEARASGVGHPVRRRCPPV